MKVIISLIVSIMTFLTAYADTGSDPYENPYARRALEEGLRFVNLYADPATYIVEDHTTEIFEGIHGVDLEEKTNIELIRHIGECLNQEPTSPSPFLKNLHDAEIKERPEYRYVLEVSPPFKGMIAACLQPKDKRTGMAGGELTVTMFLFRYEETTGEIIQLQNVTVCVD